MLQSTVAAVDVAGRYSFTRIEELAVIPKRSRVSADGGEVVPTPTYPLLLMMKLVAVEEPITNCGPVPVNAAVGFIEKTVDHGVDDAIAIPAVQLLACPRFSPTVLAVAPV